MALIDSKEVCEMLSISKSTLYRWCSIADDPLDSVLSGGAREPRAIDALRSSVRKTLNEINKNNPHAAAMSELRRLREDDVPHDFPRPFKIGRSFKWDKTEISEWLNTKRV